MNVYELLLRDPSVADLKSLAMLYLFGEDLNISLTGVVPDFDPITNLHYLSVNSGSEITRPSIQASLPFSLSNIPSRYTYNLIYNSEFQKTFEGVDKSFIEKGDIVVCLPNTTSIEVGDPNSLEGSTTVWVPSEEDIGTIEASFDEFIKIPSFEGTDSNPVDIYIGVSNVTQSDFFIPLEGIKRVVVGQDKFDQIKNEAINELIN